MTGFPSALGVVRLQIDAPDCFVASLPMPAKDACELVESFSTAVARVGAGSALLAFKPDPANDQVVSWIRASAVLVVEVVPTEDPSC